jgi:hypothetical protein
VCCEWRDITDGHSRHLCATLESMTLMVRAFPDAELEEASKPHRRELQALFAEYARDRDTGCAPPSR